MTREKARGQILAVSPEFLLRKVDVVLQRRRVRESLRRRILAEAAELVVELVLKDVHRAKSRRGTGRARREQLYLCAVSSARRQREIGLRSHARRHGRRG